MERSELLVEPDRLRAAIEAGAPPRLLDLRWYSDGRSPRTRFAAGHLPGAALVDLDADITAASGPGRHPLPDARAFEAAMRRVGLRRGEDVVVYGDERNGYAARLWWMLRLYGHEGRVRLLDGGLEGYGGALEQGEPVAVQEGDFVAREPDPGRIATLAEVRDLPPGTVLLDARSPVRFRGEERHPLDPLAGHIPGAVNAYWSENLGVDGRFLDAAELHDLYAARGAAGPGDVIASCGSGVTACHDLVALLLAGLPEPRVYVGSFSEWSRQPGAVVQP
jgi:thiosulfate/3-mercaptopyruvate sulfurtransferase